MSFSVTFGAGCYSFSGQRGVQGGGKVVSCTHAQMSDLCGSRVYLDEVGVAGFCFQHEIEPVETRKD